MTNVTTRAYSIIDPDALNIQVNPVDATISPGVQSTQVIQIECVSPFAGAPLLDINLKFATGLASFSFTRASHLYSNACLLACLLC